MAYTTKEIVRAATGFSDAAKISDATINTYIADADGLIDSMIADVYEVPLSTTPAIIGTLSRHIATGLLYSNEYGEESEDTDKGWLKRMNWAMGVLEKIQKQKIKLRTTAGVELTRTSLLTPESYPNDTSSELTADDSTAPEFKMNSDY
jgi:phage gp36-like protein